jgi:hypothetical protein
MAAVLSVAWSSATCCCASSTAVNASWQATTDSSAPEVVDVVELELVEPASVELEDGRASPAELSVPTAAHTTAASSSACWAVAREASTSFWASTTAWRAWASSASETAAVWIAAAEPLADAEAPTTTTDEVTEDKALGMTIEPPEPAPVAPGPETSSPFSARSSVTSAASSAACFSATVASRSLVSRVASCWPVVTVSPTSTETEVIVPSTAKATRAWETGSMVPTRSSVRSTGRVATVAVR